MWPIGVRVSHVAEIVELPALGEVTDTPAGSSRPRFRNVPTFAEAECSLRIDMYDCSRLVSFTSATRLVGFDSEAPKDGVAVKLRTSGAFVSGERLRLTQMVAPAPGFTAASPAAYPVAVARTVCGAATVQTS